MNDALREIAALIEDSAGIAIKDSQLPALSAAIARLAPGVEAERFLADLREPLGGEALLARLIDEVAIQETYFLREPRELEAVDWHRLLAESRLRGAAEVRVWVAACASGEEAYSVAMLASEAFGNGVPPVSILATDISGRALRRARAGVYSERSTRGIDPARRELFFDQDGPRAAVGGRLRDLVRFAPHNLVGDPSPPAGASEFDLILCRNVLIYFGSETVESVVGSLESALRPGGQLILGAADRLSSSARRLADLAARAPDAAEAIETSRQHTRRHRTREPNASDWRRQLTPRRSPPSAKEAITGALAAADGEDFRRAVELSDAVLREDPLDAEALFARGFAELADEDPTAAIGSLRRALYVDPCFALAAFQLGRAHDRRGDRTAAERAYAQALRALEGGAERHQGLIADVQPDDLVAACRARLGERRP